MQEPAPKSRRRRAYSGPQQPAQLDPGKTSKFLYKLRKFMQEKGTDIPVPDVISPTMVE